VQRLCPFQYNVGSVLFVKSKKAFIEGSAFIFKNAYIHFTACGKQFLNTSAGHFCKWINGSNNYLFDTIGNDEVAAGWRSSKMTARFKAYINSAFFNQAFFGDRINSIYFGVSLSCFFMPTFPNDLIIIHQNAAYLWVWISFSLPVFSKLNAALYIFFVYLHATKIGFISNNE